MTAYDAITEALNYAKPDNEDEAREVAETALNDYIDGELTYHSTVMELWNGDTHMEVYLADFEDIMDAIRVSTFYQLQEDYQHDLDLAVEGYLEGLEDDA